MKNYFIFKNKILLFKNYTKTLKKLSFRYFYLSFLILLFFELLLKDNNKINIEILL